MISGFDMLFYERNDIIMPCIQDEKNCHRLCGSFLRYYNVGGQKSLTDYSTRILVMIPSTWAAAFS